MLNFISLVKYMTKNCGTITRVGLKNFKYQEPVFYSGLYYNYEEGHFEVPSGHMKVGTRIKPVPGAPKFNFSGNQDC